MDALKIKVEQYGYINCLEELPFLLLPFQLFHGFVGRYSDKEHPHLSEDGSNQCVSVRYIALTFFHPFMVSLSLGGLGLLGEKKQCWKQNRGEALTTRHRIVL